MRTPRPIFVASSLVAVAAVAVVASLLVIDGSSGTDAAGSQSTGRVQTMSLTKQVSLSGSIESAAVWDIGGDGSSALRTSTGTAAISSQAGSIVQSVAVRTGARVKRGQALAFMDDTIQSLRVTAAQRALATAIEAREELTSTSGTTVTTSSSPGGSGGGGSAATVGAARQSRQASSSVRSYAAPTTDVANPGGDSGGDDAGGGVVEPGVVKPVAGTKPGATTGGGDSAGAQRPASGGGMPPTGSTTTKRESTAAIVARADAAITAARASLTAAKEGLAATVLRAPTAGVVVAQRLTRGGSAPSGAAITIRSTGVRVTLAVEEEDVIGMSVGDAATIAIAALDASLEGRVEAVGAASGGGSGASSVVTFPVTVVVDARVAGLRDGMSANVVVSTASVDDALVVPVSAIRRTSSSTSVRVRDADGDVRKVDVEIGLETEQGVQITGGRVQAGDVVELRAITGARQQTNMRSQRSFGGTR